jgi:lactoylglutathione lyase
MKFGHIGIKVLDIEKSLAFYQDVLEARVLKDYQYPESRLVFLDVGGTIVELIYKEANEPRHPGPIEHIAFKVESLDEKIAMLNSAGVPLLGDPRVVGKARIQFFKGPNGERFEFVERYEG